MRRNLMTRNEVEKRKITRTILVMKGKKEKGH
jgi:hypothetical protein